jgi:hypothetical protein
MMMHGLTNPKQFIVFISINRLVCVLEEQRLSSMQKELAL